MANREHTNDDRRSSLSTGSDSESELQRSRNSKENIESAGDTNRTDLFEVSGGDAYLLECDEKINLNNMPIRQLEGLFCLNDFHKAAGSENKHRPSLFISNAQTKDLIEEIEQSSNSCLGISQNGNSRLEVFKTIHGGKYGGTYVCKELVYSYAMWISPKFHLQVIRAFDNAQQPQKHLPATTPNTAALETSFQETEKYQVLNNMVKAMKLESDPVVIPSKELVDLIQAVRMYQTQIAQLRTPDWVNDNITRVKDLAKRNFTDF